ncbi:type IV toxin-antitoxin system AbiEi family antitoxin domain-containing protein [Gordonia sp. MP11Mi]|uniref:DUF559 domain-containing protein n=1 Tax=Gordonia sp. MP11Mi TaxID=3022769 RepID=A0AA97GTG3_9ACTN
MDTGVYSRGQLIDRGLPRRDFERAVADGDLVRLRHGWYATQGAMPEVVRAVKAGGVLSCASALRLHGVWVLPTDRLHVRGNAATARAHPTWCRRYGRQSPEVAAVDDLPTALLHAVRCLSREGFAVVCESVLNKGLMTPSALETLFGGSPAAMRALTMCDGRAESGTETMVRLRLRTCGATITPQAQIPEVGRVDLLIGASMIIEVDGFAYHADPEAFENDRLRDLHARAVGYDPIRLTYRQVVYQWDVVGPLLAELISRGDHLRPLGSRFRHSRV